MPELEAHQRKYLRGLAHALEPVVQVGSAGLTDAVLRQVDEALEAHELIKVRLMKPEDKRAMADELATRTASCACGLVGHTVILYRPDREEPSIRLPRR